MSIPLTDPEADSREGRAIGLGGTEETGLEGKGTGQTPKRRPQEGKNRLAAEAGKDDDIGVDSKQIVYGNQNAPIAPFVLAQPEMSLDDEKNRGRFLVLTSRCPNGLVPFVARKLRLQYDGAVYHVMNRGNHREDIFRDDSDRRLFLDTLEETCAKTHWHVHAWCLMSNHFHFTPLVGSDPHSPGGVGSIH